MTSRLNVLRKEWRAQLSPGERAAVTSWASFTTTFVGTRALTHWIRGGHGPKGGGMSMGGHHFHHYNLGIAMLTTIGAIAIRGEEKSRRHPGVAIAYGAGNALIVDELALLLDLEDVYWSKDGRHSVDVAIAIIAAGGTVLAGLPFFSSASKALAPTVTTRA